MLSFLYKLFVGKFDICKHEWDVFYQENRKITDLHTGKVTKEYIRYHMKCKKCGASIQK